MNEVHTKNAIKVLEVTPEMARSLLERGGKNRPLRNARVKKYAEAMQAGEWIFNGDAIKINPKGEVIDGQHRLWACVDAQTPFKTLIVYDIEDEAFITFDDGGPRTLGDALAIEGVQWHTITAAGLGWVWLYDTGGMVYNQRPSKSRGSKRQLLDFYRKCNARAWQRAAKWGYEARGMFGSTGVAAACHFIFQRESISKADSFFEALLYGAVNEGPITLLRKRLMRDQHALRADRIRTGAKFALVLKAWNAWVTDTPVKRLVVRSSENESFPIAVIKGGKDATVA